VLETPFGPVEYVAAGEGEPLLAFHGALGNAESMEWFVNSFARDFRVLVPSLGDRSDPAQIARCAAAILEAEGIEQASVFGISFGGLVAQAFLEHHPDQVRRIILMSCPPLRRAASFAYGCASGIARSLPLPVLRFITRTILTRRLADATGAGNAAKRALQSHRRRLDDFGRRFTREVLVARLSLAARIHRREPRFRDVLRLWCGPMLLMIADDDPLFDRRALARLRKAFPDAQLHTFDGGGHVIPLLHGEAMRRVIREFVRDQATASSFLSPSSPRHPARAIP